MSISSYRRNEARGVTGPYKPTCFPASLEQLSPYSLPPRVYREYQDFIGWYYLLRKEHREQRIDEYVDMVDELVEPLGNLCCRDLVFKKATTPVGLKRVVNRLIAEGYGVALDIRTQIGVHTVGLLPVEDGYFTLVSNHVPPSLRGVVTLDKIMPRLNIPRDKQMIGYPINDANITALPYVA
jgi:hypothetical protein